MSHPKVEGVNKERWSEVLHLRQKMDLSVYLFDFTNKSSHLFPDCCPCCCSRLTKVAPTPFSIWLLPPVPPGGFCGIQRSGVIYNTYSGFRVCSGVSSQLDIPEIPEGSKQGPSWSDARGTLTGSFLCWGAEVFSELLIFMLQVNPGTWRRNSVQLLVGSVNKLELWWWLKTTDS